MKREVVTLREDLGTPIECAIQTGEFSDRGTSVRRCIQENFANHLDDTAELLVSHQDLDRTDIVEALDLNRQHLATIVATIGEEARPTKVTTYLDEVKSESTPVGYDDERAQTDDGAETPELADL